MQLDSLMIDGQQIAFRQSVGSDSAVLLIHGNSSCSRAFERQLESDLGRTHRLVAIDLPGFGDSQPVSDADAVLGLQGWARIAVKAAEALGLEDAVLVGWSLGGHVALEALADLPHCKGVLIFGTPPLAFPPDMAAAFLPNPAMGAAFNATLSEEEMRAFTDAFFAPGYADAPAFYLEDVRRADGRARAAVAASIRPGGYQDEVEIVRNLRIPLAVVQGEQEQLVGLPYLQGLEMPTLWRGEVQVIEGAGHAPQWEQPAVFNSLLAAFVADCNRLAEGTIMQTDPVMSEQYPRAALFGTEARTLFSTIRGREYHLSVALPDSYKSSTQAYPVIYVLDGDFNFGVAAGLTRFSNWFRQVPELIIVGVGYDIETPDEFVALRDLDFDVPEMPGAATDSAPDLFLDALTQEIIPFINANYRTIPSDRCLQGYSSSGIFVLYALFQQPDAFQRYISGSAILKSTYDYWIQHDAQLAARDASNPIRLYLSVGELEEDDLPNFHQFVAFLKQGNYSGLTVSSEIYAGEGHGAEGIALTYLHGIAAVYPQVER